MVALITGGTKGIGLAVALEFARAGEAVVVTYGGDRRAADVASRELAASGTRSFEVLHEDVSAASDDGAVHAVGRMRASVSEPVHFVHCAVRAVTQPTRQFDVDDFIRAVAVNGAPLVAITNRLHAAGSLAPGSTVCLVSSEGPRQVVPGYIHVGASKAAGETFVRYLAAEYGAEGVRANTVIAGPVLTDALRAVLPDAEAVYQRLARRNPSGRGVDAIDVARVIMSLTTPAYSMVNGAAIRIDGGAGVLS